MLQANNIAFRLLENKFSFICYFLIALLIVIPFLSIFYLYEFQSIEKIYSAYYLRIIFFTISQSFLSSIIAISIGIFAARLLFKHRSLQIINKLVSLMPLLFVSPTLIVVLGIISLYGTSSKINKFFMEYLDHSFSIYGLSGILLCHVILNLPIVIRVMYQSLSEVSSDEWALAEHTNIRGLGLFKSIEWPVLKRNIPVLLILIFFLCFVSFVPILILGGGPKFSTLEIAVYQSILFEFNFAKGLNLILIQIIISAIFFYLFFFIYKYENFVLSENKRFKPSIKFSKKYFLEYLLIAVFILFIFSPLIMIILNGFSEKIISILYSSYFWYALKNTFLISFFSGLLSVLISFGAMNFIHDKNFFKIQKKLEFIVFLPLVVSPIMISAGYYILIKQILSLSIPTIIILIFINSIFTVPFSYSFLINSFRKLKKEHDEISKVLLISGWKKFLLIDWPKLRNPFATAFATSSILSAGDLAVISFLGTNDLSTINLSIYRLMGSYRIDEAQSLSLFLLIYCILYFIFSKILINKIRFKIS